MNRLGRANIMLFLGAISAQLIWTGEFGWFLQQRMRIPLAIAAGVLLVFGLYEAFSSTIGQDDDHDHDHHHEHSDDHDHDHDHDGYLAGPRVGWFLTLPVLALLLVAPAALGAASADRVDAFQPTKTTDEFPALPDSDEPVEMRVYEFLDRAVWDEQGSLEGRTVRLEGLVVNDPEVPDGFKLTRFMVSCCAADGIPLQVAVRDIPAPLETETWVVADVVFRPPDVPFEDAEGDWVVEADAVSITPVIGGIPKDPYESPY